MKVTIVADFSTIRDMYVNSGHSIRLFSVNNVWLTTNKIFPVQIKSGLDELLYSYIPKKNVNLYKPHP